MKFVVILLLLGIISGCGTDTRYSQTLETEQDKTGQTDSSKVAKIAGGVVAGAIVTACIVTGVKKRCIPFVKKITRTDDLSKQIRQAKAEAKDEVLFEKKWKESGIDDALASHATVSKRALELTDTDKAIRLRMEGKEAEADEYQKEMFLKAIKELVEEGKLSSEQAESLKGHIGN